MNIKLIRAKKDFRSVMDDSGNACGFLSIRGMLPADHFAKNWSFMQFMDAGQWNPAEKKGRMMDTEADECNLMQLADTLDVCIKIYSEIAPLTVNGSICAVFGCMDAPHTVHIVKEFGKSHFVGIAAFEEEEDDKSLVLAVWVDEQEKAEQMRRDEEMALAMSLIAV
jgi:hypothetical protein